MSDTNVATGDGGGESFTPVTAPTPDTVFRSVSEAARTLANMRYKRTDTQEQAAPEPAAPLDPDPPQEDADPAEEPAHGEAPEQPDPAPQEPSIEPPRSWTKEAKDQWSKLPRETQEYLLERENQRDKEVRRLQNEFAEKRKAADAEAQQSQQTRQQYEAALPRLQAALQHQLAGEFPDIRSMDDAVRLSKEDPVRFVQWQAAQERLKGVNQQLQAMQQRRASENERTWATFAEEQDKKFAELVPEFTDKEKAAKLTKAAVDHLLDLGFEEADLRDLWNGKKGVSLRDARIQRLILDGVRYREAKEQAKVAAAKPVVQVQKPGVAKPAGPSAELTQLANKFAKTGSLKDAAALRAARLKAAPRS